MNLSYIIFFFICHSKTLKWTPILFRIFHLNNKYYLKGSSNLVRIIISTYWYNANFLCLSEVLFSSVNLRKKKLFWPIPGKKATQIMVSSLNTQSIHANAIETRWQFLSGKVIIKCVRIGFYFVTLFLLSFTSKFHYIMLATQYR